MKRYVTVTITDKVESIGNDYNKGFRKCKSQELAKEIEDFCNAYEEKGYDLVSVMPVIQGQHIVISSDGGWANSTTEGAILTFRLR